MYACIILHIDKNQEKVLLVFIFIGSEAANGAQT